MEVSGPASSSKVWCELWAAERTQTVKGFTPALKQSCVDRRQRAGRHSLSVGPLRVADAAASIIAWRHDDL
jgi:hypothetical protein